MENHKRKTCQPHISGEMVIKCFYSFLHAAGNVSTQTLSTSSSVGSELHLIGISFLIHSVYDSPQVLHAQYAQIRLPFDASS